MKDLTKFSNKTTSNANNFIKKLNGWDFAIYIIVPNCSKNLNVEKQNNLFWQKITWMDVRAV